MCPTIIFHKSETVAHYTGSGRRRLVLIGLKSKKKRKMYLLYLANIMVLDGRELFNEPKPWLNTSRDSQFRFFREQLHQSVGTNHANCSSHLKMWHFNLIFLLYFFVAEFSAVQSHPQTLDDVKKLHRTVKRHSMLLVTVSSNRVSLSSRSLCIQKPNKSTAC